MKWITAKSIVIICFILGGCSKVAPPEDNLKKVKITNTVVFVISKSLHAFNHCEHTEFYHNFTSDLNNAINKSFTNTAVFSKIFNEGCRRIQLTLDDANVISNITENPQQLTAVISLQYKVIESGNINTVTYTAFPWTFIKEDGRWVIANEAIFKNIASILLAETNIEI
ncbi:hypothetical protein [Pseudoalteromonas sp. MMG010]|uniref:hypothetical protein n=1 Tax=Pseudoalteromonas sp. MMG010 TaxID=2822685 RepID=UPI001B3A326A|nr:hypothetical protein [Pseudoalteromonas sp. MMG010]